MKTVIFIILITIIISMLFINVKKFEGYVDYMMPNPDMVKNVRVVSETDRRTILSESYDSIRKHEKLFGIYDEDYVAVEIAQNPKHSIQESIFGLFKYLKKHDNQLKKMTKSHNRYVPTKTLDQLLDGSLLKSLKDDLYKIKDYEGKSLMPAETVDYDELIKEAEGYELEAAKTSGKLRDDLYKMAIRKRKDAAKKKVENKPADNTNTPVDIEPRITDEEIEARLEMVTLYHIMQIIKYQDLAVKELYSIVTEYMKNTYSI